MAEHPTAGDRAAGLSRTFVDEWVRGGVRDACISPGSRSTPLALALADDPRIRVHVFVDERSAAFFALGTSKASGRPGLVLCTSGTAAANFFPAVVEASMSRVPLLIATADRPPELRDTGAGQTIDQIDIYGDFTRWFCEVGAPDGRAGVGRYWRSIATRSVAEAFGAGTGGRPGPVQLNFAFREPLIPSGVNVAIEPGRSDGSSWTRVGVRRGQPDSADVERLAQEIARTENGLLLVGWESGVGIDAGVVERFVQAAGWPVLADAISCARTGPNAISTYEALLRSQGFIESHRPDLVFRVGAALTSKAATAWLDHDVRQVVVDPYGAWSDPMRAASEMIAADPNLLLDALADRLEESTGAVSRVSSWLEDWRATEAKARVAIDTLLDSRDELFEGRVARDIAACLPDGSTLLVASSMPVRDLEAFAAARSGLRILANRGASGIDGFTSTALGVAAAAGAAGVAGVVGVAGVDEDAGPVVALMGDLAFLHDTNGLLGAASRAIDAVLVVIDNDGGGIFSFLPQANLPEHFEMLFSTPHGLDLVAVAAAHGVEAVRRARAGEVVPEVEKAVARGGVQVIVVPTNRSDNVMYHREVWEVVADALMA